MTNVELVLFFGPPFVGKTLYYCRHYSKTHCRISALESFEKEEDTNLRHVILKAIEFLCQGKNVVIDDENWYIETRKSYSSLVKRKVPNCTLTLVQFLPEASFGYQQCLWAREWVIVHWTFLESGQDKYQTLLDSNEKLDCWFSKRKSVLNPPEFPTVDEGFSLQTVKPEFTCNTSYKFSLPGLFVQWEAIVVDADDAGLTHKPGTPELLNMWFSKNPSGRLVIIGPKSKHNKEILDERTKQVLVQLASQVSSPVYFAFIDDKHQPDQFCKLPRPGVIAFLQRLHTIHIRHKSTMYVYESEEHYKAANQVGIRIVKCEKLFANPHLINAIHCGETNQTLAFLKDFQQTNFRLPAVESSDKQSGARAEDAAIPFLSRARKSSSALVWRYCCGKVSGICFKDKLILERYQTQYTLAAVPTRPPTNTPAVNLDKQGNIAEGISSAASSSTCTSSKSNTKGRSLENADLRDIAETPGRFQGGFLCKEKIFNMNVEVIDYKLKITCKCMGSNNQQYDVQAIVSNSSGLVEAHCSCPDPVAKSGRCKHVIGLLMNYRDRDALTSGVDRPRKGCSTKTIEKKKIPKRDAETLYCMSQEELLQTAKEILEKHKESQVRESEEASETDTVGNDTLAYKVVSEKERTVDERSCRNDILEELIFGREEGDGKRHKKLRTERLPSFAEETPPEKLARKLEEDACADTVIIPDSLVPETVTIIPESIESVSEERSTQRDTQRGTQRGECSARNERIPRWEKNGDFLHELI